MKSILRFCACFIMITCLEKSSAQVIVLNSYPSAASTIYLDFDGQYVTGTSWNWGGPIKAAAASLSNTSIKEIVTRVAEDFRPFNINITTDSLVYKSAPAYKKIRVIITASHDWYGLAGGVSFIGSFTWGDETPCWVFSSLLGNNTKWIAEAAAHEAGHTLSLHHQSRFDLNCKKTSEYSAGQGEGEIGWAPIMGVGYYKNLTTWHKGPNTISCNRIQSDIDIIAARVGLKTDDHGNNNLSATQLSILGTSFEASGLINHSGDADVFRIFIPTPTHVSINGIPNNVGKGNDGANIDIRLALMNANEDTIGTYNPSTILSAGIDTNLNSGYYYLVVKGASNVNLAEYGSVGFYSLSGQMATVLPVHDFILKGNSDNTSHLLNWSVNSDQKLKHFAIERSLDGNAFHVIATVSPELGQFRIHTDVLKSYYRVKATTTRNDKVFYSNTIALQTTKNRGIQLMNSVANDQVIVNSSGMGSYRVYDETGKLLTKGRLAFGKNALSISRLSKGIFFIQFDDGMDAWTERIIKY